MSTPAATPPAADLSVDERDGLEQLLAHAVAPATRRSYASDWARWQAWCTARAQRTQPSGVREERVGEGTAVGVLEADPDQAAPATNARQDRGRHAPGIAAMLADPNLVAVYLQEHAALLNASGKPAYAPATLARWVSSINTACRASGYPAPGEHPLVATTLAAIRRSRTHDPRRRDPLLLSDLKQLATHLSTTASCGTRFERVAATRDLAILALGLFGAFRRSELAALRLSDITVHPKDGLHVRLPRSKTDQDGAGIVKPIPPHEDPRICAVCAVLAWANLVHAWDTGGRPGLIRAIHLTRTPPSSSAPNNPTPNDPGTTTPHRCAATPPHKDPTGHGQILAASTGPLFRSLHRSLILRGPLRGHAINEMIQRRATAAGLAPVTVAGFGGHSLRAGFVTEAFRAGADAHEVARQTGHVSLTILAGYQREADPLRGNAVTRLGTRPTPPEPAP